MKWFNKNKKNHDSTSIDFKDSQAMTIKTPKFLKFRLIEIPISAFLVALSLIVGAIVKFTPLRFLGLNSDIELVFYTLMGFFLNLFPAMIAAFVSDFISVLYTGGLGTYFWTYALVPPLAAACSYLFFRLIRSKFTNLKLILPNLIILVASVVMIAVVQVKISETKVDSGSLSVRLIEGRNNPLRFLNNVPFVVFYSLITILILLNFFSWALTGYYYIFREQKSLLTLNSFTVLVFILLVFRWIWGPIAFIEYFNAYIAKSNNVKSYGKDYLIIMVPIVIKSLFSLALFTPILISMIVPFEWLYKRYLQNKYSIY
ncbi:hypothetical protein V2E24_00100 [Mycoplasmopsis ciconiae]|uniref:ECF transporter S component n=1 Tax=Mycoplasmopsis ciconiae TaxID=561067 RepID=A0ABU7MKK4_9BACT|nr:hypothetical protein [Mycoplasmopsis ciconiae]